MSSYSDAIAQRSALQSAIGGVADVGVVLVTWEPVKSKQEFLARYQADLEEVREVRGVIISPANPFRTSSLKGPAFTEDGEDAALFRDLWRWEITCFSQASSEAELRDEALERHLDVMDAIDALYEFVGLDSSPVRVGPAMLSTHAFGSIGPFGAWISEASFEIEVDRMVAR